MRTLLTQPAPFHRDGFRLVRLSGHIPVVAPRPMARTATGGPGGGGVPAMVRVGAAEAVPAMGRAGGGGGGWGHHHRGYGWGGYGGYVGGCWRAIALRTERRDIALS